MSTQTHPDKLRTDDVRRNGQAGRRRTMLVPVAYSESVMPALRLARSSRIAWRIANVLMVTLILSILVMAFAPWQQSITGSGNVVAFEPLLRQQTIESPIKGRLVHWGEGIHENVRVSKGDLIAEIQDLDVGFLDRLQSQLNNAQESVIASEQQHEASQRMLKTAEGVVVVLERNVQQFQRMLDETHLLQNALVEAAERRVAVEEALLAEAEAAIHQLQAQYNRMKNLVDEQIVARLTYEQSERSLLEAKQKVRRGQGAVEAAQAELRARERDRDIGIARAEAELDRTQADLERARQTVASEERSVARAWQDLQALQQQVLTLETEIARQQTQEIRAPFDGFLVNLTPNLATRIMKEGDPVATIVPDTKDRAVQLWLDGNDAPLVEPGNHVRLQFEGWPAIQFSGWPAVAVGTFGGEVVSVDATDDGRGNFRVLIRPDESDQPWPDERFLRQGVRANGWVLLRVVPLWFEVWRQLNGFPPVVEDDPSIRRAN